MPDSAPNDDKIPRDLIDPEVLAELAAIEEEGCITRRLNAEMADGNQSQVEQVIANMAAMDAVGLDPLLLGLLQNPT